MRSPDRTFTTTSPIRACRLRRDDLKRLYRIIDDRQIEHRDSILNVFAQQPSETPAQFQERRTRVANSFTTTVNTTGNTSNEVVSGQGEEFSESATIPDSIKAVYYTTVAGPTAIG